MRSAFGSAQPSAGLRAISRCSTAYQVKGFDEVLEVEAQLVDNGLTPVTAAKQVESLKETFTQLQTLFVIVSGFIVVIALIAAADG